MTAKNPQATKRIFLLSPANLSGRRAEILLREAASFELALRLRSTGAPLGDVFSFVSGLYFRGKLAYSNTFAEPGKIHDSVFVITATRGLVAPHAPIDHTALREMAGVPISCADSRYIGPLERDLAELARRVSASTKIILLGSIATPKYLQPLSRVFGERLLVPLDFVGRGDMSRGALMLRAVREMVQLTYAPARSLEPDSPKPQGRRVKASSSAHKKKPREKAP